MGRDQNSPDQQPVLVVRLQGCLAALKLGEVEEVMRPLPTSPLADVPHGVVGIALIRGVSMPVVDLGALLGEAAAATFGRYVVARVGEHRVALAVRGVEGVVNLEASTLDTLPPLLHDTRMEAIGVSDRALLLMLSSARVVPPELWASLGAFAEGSA